MNQWPDVHGHVRELYEDGVRVEFYLEVNWRGMRAFAMRRHFKDDLEELPKLYAVCLNNMIAQLEREFDRATKDEDKVDAARQSLSAYQAYARERARRNREREANMP